MSERWQIEGLSSAHWIATPRGLSTEELPRGTVLSPEIAARFVDEWFPEGPNESARTSLLADVCAAAGSRAGLDDAPPALHALKAAVTEALHEGRLVVLRIKAVTPAFRRVEVEVEGEQKPAEVVTHWVEFEIKDQEGNPAAGLEYTLILAGAGPEDGTLKAEAIVHRTGVKKGTHQIHVKTLSRARWGDPLVGEVAEDVEVTLVADVTGFAPGTKGELKIHDANDLTGEGLATVEGTVHQDRPRLEANWTPGRDVLMRAKSGQLVLVASMPKLRSTSAPIRALCKHEIVVKDQTGHIADNTVVRGRFSDGTAFEGLTKDDKVTVRGPAGQKLVWASVAGKLGIPTTFKPDGAASRAFVTPERAKQ